MDKEVRAEWTQAQKLATQMGLRTDIVHLEDMTVGQSTAELVVGARNETWSACGMTWTATTHWLRKSLPAIGYGRRLRWTALIETTRIA